jgi:hypothetical protein
MIGMRGGWKESIRGGVERVGKDDEIRRKIKRGKKLVGDRRGGGVGNKRDIEVER